MNFIKYFFVLSLTLKTINIFAQNKIDTFKKPSSFEDVISNIREDDFNEDFIIHLKEIYDNPININNGDIKNLKKIPFLSDKQIEDLSYYLYRYKKIDNFSELMLVESLNNKTIRNILPFICLNKKTTNKIKSNNIKNYYMYGKNDLSYFISNDFPRRKGFINNQYLGSPFQMGIKYNFKYKNDIEFGTSFEKDGGENIKNGHFTYYAAIHNFKNFKDINIFDFKIHLGQGLICGSGFSLGKNTSGLSPSSNTKQIRKHNSYSEYGYFTGFAFRYGINKSLELTSFASNTPVQAKIEEDTIRTLYYTNYNRTQVERDRKDAKIYTFGTQLSFQKDNKRIELNSIYYKYNYPFFKDLRSYNVYDFRGNENYNISISYKAYISKTLFYGEAACDKDFNKAFLIGNDFNILTNLSCSLLYRNYNKKYMANYANSFGESSKTKNEEGLYSSFEWDIIKNFRLNTYLDFYKFRGLKYRVSKPSKGYDFSTRISYSPKRNSELYLIIKNEKKSRDKKNEKGEKIVSPFIWTQYKINYKKNWDKIGLNYALYLKHCKGYSKAFTCSLRYKNKRSSSSVNTSIFKANNYDNRLYVYENSLPGFFGMSMLYKKGYKINLLEKIEFTEKYLIYLKINGYYIANSTYHSSGLNRTEGKLLSNIKIMLRMKF